MESLNYVLLVSSCPPLSVGLTPPSSRYTHRTPRERDGPSRPRNQPGPPHYFPEPGALSETLSPKVQICLICSEYFIFLYRSPQCLSSA